MRAEQQSRRRDSLRRQAAAPLPGSRLPLGSRRTVASLGAVTYADRRICTPLRETCFRRVPGPGCVVMGPFVGVRALAGRLLFRDPPRGGAHHRRGRYARTGLTTAARSGRSVSPKSSHAVPSDRRGRSWCKAATLLRAPARALRLSTARDARGFARLRARRTARRYFSAERADSAPCAFVSLGAHASLHSRDLRGQQVGAGQTASARHGQPKPAD
jgi:hypothetical protein